MQCTCLSTTYSPSKIPNTVPTFSWLYTSSYSCIFLSFVVLISSIRWSGELIGFPKVKPLVPSRPVPLLISALYLFDFKSTTPSSSCDDNGLSEEGAEWGSSKICFYSSSWFQTCNFWNTSNNRQLYSCPHEVMEFLPPGTDIAKYMRENQNERLIGSSVALIALSTIFVLLRLASRKVSKAGFWVRFYDLHLDSAQGIVEWLLTGSDKVGWCGDCGCFGWSQIAKKERLKGAYC